MPRLCRCGKIVEDRCECFSGASKQLTRSTTAEGHGNDHRKASERYRAEHPLCERCVQLHGVMHAKPSKDMHHIVSIRKDATQRMSRGNWLAVCGEHHEELEGNEIDGMACKRWSEANYTQAMDTPSRVGGASQNAI
jgi:hypothetical protein